MYTNQPTNAFYSLERWIWECIVFINPIINLCFNPQKWQGVIKLKCICVCVCISVCPGHFTSRTEEPIFLHTFLWLKLANQWLQSKDWMMLRIHWLFSRVEYARRFCILFVELFWLIFKGWFFQSIDYFFYS